MGKNNTKTTLATTTIIAGVAILSLSLSLSLSGSNTRIETNSNNNSLSNRFSLDLTTLSQNNNEEEIIALDIDTVPTNDGYIFLGYAWNKNATTPDYVYNSSNKTFTPNSITLNSSDPDKTLYAVWKDSFESGLSISYLQDMNSSICSSMPTATTTTGTYKLKDRRDNKIYTIAKMADGKCWMTQNLALELSTSKTLTDSDTDLNVVSSWTPSMDTITVVDSCSKNKNASCYYGDSVKGVYYGQYTARILINNSDYVVPPSGITTRSICPKNWTLPTRNQFSTMINAYKKSSTSSEYTNYYNFRDNSPFNLAFAGFGTAPTNTLDWYWTIDNYYKTGAPYYALVSSTWFPANYRYVTDDDIAPFSVRCIAR